MTALLPRFLEPKDFGPTEDELSRHDGMEGLPVEIEEIEFPGRAALAFIGLTASTVWDETNCEWALDNLIFGQERIDDKSEWKAVTDAARAYVATPAGQSMAEPYGEV